MKLIGTYTEDATLEYVCRIFPWGDGRAITWINGVGEVVHVEDTDVLQMLGQGTWFALYRRKK